MGEARSVASHRCHTLGSTPARAVQAHVSWKAAGGAGRPPGPARRGSGAAGSGVRDRKWTAGCEGGGGTGGGRTAGDRWVCYVGLWDGIIIARHAVAFGGSAQFVVETAVAKLTAAETIAETAYAAILGVEHA